MMYLNEESIIFFNMLNILKTLFYILHDKVLTTHQKDDVNIDF